MQKLSKNSETDNSKIILLEEALRESETKFRYFVEAAADGIITADGMGKIVSWNGMARKMFGYKDKDVIGKPLTILMPKRYISEHTKGVDRFSETGESRVIGTVYEVHGLRKDGTEFPLELSLASWELNKGRFFVGILRDITERKKAMDSLEEANKRLRETQVQLVQSEKMASLGMLVAGVAHEINTPLGAIMSMHDTLIRAVNKMKGFVASSLSSETTNNDTIKKTIDVIDDADNVINSGTARIKQIVKQLRSFIRLDESEMQKANVNECLEETIKLFTHELKNKVKLIKNFADLPEIVCYPAKLNQVFLNLLINSNQAIDNEGKISINTSMENGNICITIIDNGEGIPESSLDKIFDPGYTTKGVGVGMGLGLSISYKIIQEHEGDISVESEEGKGSIFKITLPTDLMGKLKGAK